MNGAGRYGGRRILSLSKEDFQRFREHMEAREPSPDKIWIPLPKWQVQALIEDGLITEGEIESAPYIGSLP